MNGACRGSLYLRYGRLRKAESCVQIRLRLSQNASDLKTDHHDMAVQDAVPRFE